MTVESGFSMYPMILPGNNRELTIAYFVWTSFYLLVNIVWDIFSPRTPAFHMHRLKSKVETLFNAVTFTSSLLIVASIFDQKTAEVLGSTGLAFVLAGGSGFLVSIAGICPYLPKSNGKTENEN